MNTGSTKRSLSTPVNAISVSSRMFDRVARPIDIPNTSAPCAMRCPKRVVFANSSLVWSSVKSPVSPANAVTSASVTVRPRVTRSPLVSKSSKYSPTGLTIHNSSAQHAQPRTTDTRDEGRLRVRRDSNTPLGVRSAHRCSPDVRTLLYSPIAESVRTRSHQTVRRPRGIASRILRQHGSQPVRVGDLRGTVHMAGAPRSATGGGVAADAHPARLPLYGVGGPGPGGRIARSAKCLRDWRRLRRHDCRRSGGVVAVDARQSPRYTARVGLQRVGLARSPERLLSRQFHRDAAGAAGVGVLHSHSGRSVADRHALPGVPDSSAASAASMNSR